MSMEDLQAFRRKRKLSVPDRKLTNLRYTEEASALFGDKREAVAYATSAFPHYGDVHIDLAYYKPENKEFNEGMQGGKIYYP